MNTVSITHISDAHALAIGRVITTWPVAHFFLGSALCAVIADGDVWEGDKSIAIVVNGMTPRTITGLLRTFVRLRFPKDDRAFTKLLDRFSAIEKTRDAFAHAIWTPCEGDPSRIEPGLVKTVGGLRKARASYSVSEINEVTAAIKHLCLQLAAFLLHWGIAPPFPEKDE